MFVMLFYLITLTQIKEIADKKSQVIDQRFANVIATAIVNVNGQLDTLYGLSLDYGRLKIDSVVEELKRIIRYIDN